MTYYLTVTVDDRRYRLPFPHATRAAAECHREAIGNTGDIVEVCERVRVVDEDDAWERDENFRKWNRAQEDYQEMMRR